MDAPSGNELTDAALFVTPRRSNESEEDFRKRSYIQSLIQSNKPEWRALPPSIVSHDRELSACNATLNGGRKEIDYASPTSRK